MDGNLVTTTIGKPVEATGYRGMAGEQAFYAALTLNLGWFEREMAVLAGVLRSAVTAPDRTGRTTRAAH